MASAFPGHQSYTQLPLLVPLHLNFQSSQMMHLRAAQDLLLSHSFPSRQAAVLFSDVIRALHSAGHPAHRAFMATRSDSHPDHSASTLASTHLPEQESQLRVATPTAPQVARQSAAARRLACRSQSLRLRLVAIKVPSATRREAHSWTGRTRSRTRLCQTRLPDVMAHVSLPADAGRYSFLVNRLIPSFASDSLQEQKASQ